MPVRRLVVHELWADGRWLHCLTQRHPCWKLRSAGPVTPTAGRPQAFLQQPVDLAVLSGITAARVPAAVRRLPCRWQWHLWLCSGYIMPGRCRQVPRPHAKHQGRRSKTSHCHAVQWWSPGIVAAETAEPPNVPHGCPHERGSFLQRR
jgi:hypothetical protein